MLGPEFAIMTTGTAIQRANFVNRMVFTSPAIAGGTTNSPNGLSMDFTDLQALNVADNTGNQLVDELNRRMLHGTMSSAMKSTILTARDGRPVRGRRSQPCETGGLSNCDFVAVSGPEVKTMKETRRDFLKKTGGCALGMVGLATQMQSPRHDERDGARA